MVPQRLVVDFVAPPAPAGFGRVLLGLAALAVVAGGVQLALAWQAYRQEKAELASVTQRGVVPAADGARRSTVNSSGLQSAGTVARGLTAPWPDLLQSIESIRSKDISLQIVEPIAARQSLRITADARHFEAMLDYLEELRSRALTEVVLMSHQVQVKEPGAPIRFQVQAKWGEAVATTRAANSAPTAQASTADDTRGPR